MSMLEEIDKFMISNNTSINYRIINLSGNNMYVEGIKSVISFSNEVMKFQLKTKVLTISGKGLKIKYLDKTSCVLTGEIFSEVTQ